MPCEKCPKAWKCLYYQSGAVQWCDEWQQYNKDITLTVTDHTIPKEKEDGTNKS